MHSASPDPVFCFGPFQAHKATGKLLRNGREVSLQDQPFRLLVALLERPGSMVSRQELKEILWPSGIVEFDKSLDVAMAKLRRALGDDASSPQFIETIPRRGYRFIAIRRLAGDDLAAPADKTPALAVVPQARRRPGLAASGVFALILAAAAGAWWHGRSPGSHPLEERAAVLVGDFANLTGDPSFDRVLRTAAATYFAQSPYLTVVSDERIGTGLQELGRPPDAPLEPAIARQVCQNQHAAVAVNGRVEPQASGYLLTVVASRCSDGSTFASIGTSARGKSDVLAALAQSTSRLRAAFGESRESLKKYDVTLVQGTTNSLEALKAYQLGMELRSHTRNIDAIPVFKTAIALDPNFAIAYAQLGSCYSNMQETELATQFFAKAFELRQHATEPERLYIAGRYFDIVTGEMEKGASIYKLWTEIYPSDWRGFIGMANDANVLGRYGVAADAAAKAIALEPQHAHGYTNRALALLGMSRLGDSAEVADEAVRRGLDGSVMHGIMYSIALMRNDGAGLQRERTWGAARPEEVGILNLDAQLAESQGRIGESTRLFAQLVERTRSLGLLGYAQTALAQEALFDAEFGLRKQALGHVQASGKLGINELALELSALVYARLGDAASAQALLTQINHDFPLSTFNISVFAPAIRTALAVSNGHDAKKILEAVNPDSSYDTGQQAVLIPTYVRAMALLEAGSAIDAEAEFRKIVKNPGVDATSPYHSLAYLGLARALTLQNRPVEAGQAYELLMQLWRGADADLPVVVQARHEYTALQKTAHSGPGA